MRKNGVEQERPILPIPHRQLIVGYTKRDQAGRVEVQETGDTFVGGREGKRGNRKDLGRRSGGGGGVQLPFQNISPLCSPPQRQNSCFDECLLVHRQAHHFLLLSPFKEMRYL